MEVMEEILYPRKGFVTGWITYVRRNAFGVEAIKVLKFRKRAEFLLTNLICSYWDLIFNLRCFGYTSALYYILNGNLFKKAVLSFM